MHSQKLREFSEEIKFKNRNPRNVELLKRLDDVTLNPTEIVQPGTLFYRCRIVKDNLENINSEHGFSGYNAAGSFVAPVFATKDMRANYRFIPYLYVASTKKLAIFETRPEKEDKVSVATIVVDEELTLFDLRQTKDLSDKKRTVKDNFLIDLAELYSKPVNSTDDQADYIPTQFIAEYIKQLDYDGIIYPSSHGGDKNNEYSIVVFSYNKCHASGSELIDMDEEDK